MRTPTSDRLAHLGHEIRTPLNAIIGFAELMAKGKVGPISDDHKEYLGDILTSSRQLLQVIDDALDLAKLESGSMEFRIEPTDVGRIVAQVRDDLGGLAVDKRIQVDLDVAVTVTVTEIVLDPSKLGQVVRSYLSNALKFTPDGGHVTIRVREVPAGVRIEVEDTGVGIPPEDTHRLFVEFQRLATGLEYPGAGLGLALTKRIVEAQGGEVGVRTETGKGSTFWATLPRGKGGST